MDVLVSTTSRDMNDRLLSQAGSIGVVLVNWNGAEHTIPCIESLLAGTVKPDRIVVVDNGSRDGSPDKIAERFPDIDLIRNSENLGFTGANNIGINSLMTEGCSYIWILNNDTTVDRQCLAVLKEYMEKDSDVAACSGKILFADPQNLIWYAGATYNPWTVRIKHRGHAEKDRGQYDTVERVPFISGCCMFVRREAIERVGVFDDIFFIYGEDTDWCLRAEKAKMRLDYVPLAVIWHKVTATVKKAKDPKTRGSTSAFIVYLTSRNSLYLIRMHSGNLFQKCTASSSWALWTCYYGAILLFLGRLEKFKALVMSVYDGILQPLDAVQSIAKMPRYRM